jgi:hypothetical protein
VIDAEAVDLPQVIVGACGCILPATALPVGFRFVATSTGDKRQLVYGCPEHTHTGALTASKQPAALKVPKNRRSGRPSRAAKAPAAS